MNIEAIPKSFWHSASFALIAFTIGFLFISYKSGELTVKFKELEVRTSETIVLEESLKKQKESIMAQQEIILSKESEITELNKIPQQRIEELNTVKEKLAKLEEENESSAIRELASNIGAIKENQDFDLMIQERQQNLESLSRDQVQQQQVYQQQKEIFQQQQKQQQALY